VSGSGGFHPKPGDRDAEGGEQESVERLFTKRPTRGASGRVPQCARQQQVVGADED
jgi:hypothetical protein